MPITASFQEIVSALGAAGPLTIGALVVAALAGLWITVAVQSRRRFREELRNVVQALEELRSGKGRGHSELMQGSRLAILSDAVNRLGIDLHATTADAYRKAA